MDSQFLKLADEIAESGAPEEVSHMAGCLLSHLEDNWSWLAYRTENAFHMAIGTSRSNMRSPVWTLMKGVIGNLRGTLEWVSSGLAGSEKGVRDGVVKAQKQIEAVAPMLDEFGRAAAEEGLLRLPGDWMSHMESVVGCGAAFSNVPGGVLLRSRLGGIQASMAAELEGVLMSGAMASNSKPAEAARAWARAASRYWKCLMVLGYPPAAALDATMHRIEVPW